MKRKKMLLAGALALVMVGSAIGGTLAYLTDTASVDNVFLVGAFTKPQDPVPSPVPPGPTPGPDPYPTPVPLPEGEKVNSYIYEPYWESHGDPTWNDGKGDEHRLLAGEATTKDPYIGIGKDSESGYVLACITNPMKPFVYFTLSKGWAPVEGMVTEVPITDSNGSLPAVASGTPKFYSEGLFRWVGVDGGGNTNSYDATTLKALTPADSDTDGVKEDAWTSQPVFSYVYTDKSNLSEVQKETTHTMKVWAYIAQSEGTQEGSETAITPAYVIDQAKAWAQIKDSTHPSYEPPAAGGGA